jgi:hypothetical protein
MEILLWSGLNIVAILGLLYVFFRAAQLLRQHVSWAAALFFSMGLLAIGCGKTKNQASSIPEQNLLGAVPKGTPLGNGSSLQNVKFGFNTLQLLAEYRAEQGIAKPRGLYASIAGLTLGHTWQPIAGTVVQRGQQLYYTATLSHEWTLLGNLVYTNSETYEGFMPIAKR